MNTTRRFCTALGLTCVVAALAPSAQAATAIAHAGCPGAVVWHVSYREFWRQGDETLPRGDVDALEQTVRTFAADVAEDSACGLAVDVDVDDEGDADYLWERSAVPEDRHDWSFDRYPGPLQPVTMPTVATADAFRPAPYVNHSPSVFPYAVDAASCTTTCADSPSALDLERAFVNAVVDFYQPRQGWPTGTAGGATAHGYDGPDGPRRYLADLLQGKVQEGGAERGMLADEWARQGTPDAPLIVAPRSDIKIDGDRGTITVTPLSDLDAPMTVNVFAHYGDDAPIATSTGGGPLSLTVPTGATYFVCVAVEGSERFRDEPTCTWHGVTPTTQTLGPTAQGAVHYDAPTLLGIKSARNGVALTVRRPSPNAAVRVVARKGTAYVVDGDGGVGTTTVVRLRLAPGTWRLRLVATYPGGRTGDATLPQPLIVSKDHRVARTSIPTDGAQPPAGYVGGTITAASGEKIVISALPGYAIDPAIAQRWGDFLASLPHTPSDTTGLRVDFLPNDVLQRACSHEYSVGGCATSSTIELDGDEDIASEESVAAHEFGHVLAFHREGDLGGVVGLLALGRWAGAAGVCDLRAKHRLSASEATPSDWAVNGDELWAETYRIMALGTDHLGWSQPFEMSLPEPGSQQLDAARADATQPLRPNQQAFAIHLDRNHRSARIVVHVPAPGVIHFQSRLTGRLAVKDIELRDATHHGSRGSMTWSRATCATGDVTIVAHWRRGAGTLRGTADVL